MNEELKYFAEELEEMLRKGHRLLNKVGQSMNQRNGGGGYSGGSGYGNRESGGQWNGGSGGSGMGERNWPGMGGYDPRFM